MQRGGGADRRFAPPEVDRLATLHTNARTDRELLAAWTKSQADRSPHTVRAYQRIGERLLAALSNAGVGLTQATVEDVQTARGVGGCVMRPLAAMSERQSASARQHFVNFRRHFLRRCHRPTSGALRLGQGS